MDDPAAPVAPPLRKRHRLRKLTLSEISLCDRPAEPHSLVHVWKMAADPAPPPAPPASTDDDPRWKMTDADREVLAGVAKAIEDAERRLPGLNNTALNALQRQTKNLAKSVAEEQIERRRMEARADAELLFERKASSENLARLLQKERQRAEELTASVQRMAERREVDAVLEARREAQEKFRKATFRRSGMTWAQWRMANGEEK